MPACDSSFLCHSERECDEHQTGNARFVLHSRRGGACPARATLCVAESAFRFCSFGVRRFDAALPSAPPCAELSSRTRSRFSRTAVRDLLLHVWTAAARRRFVARLVFVGALLAAPV